MVHAARQPDTALARALLAPLALQLFRVSLGLQLVSAAAVSVSASCPSAPSGMVLRPGHCVGRPCSEAHCDCGSELVKGQCAVSADYAACVKTVAANCSADARPVAPDISICTLLVCKIICTRPCTCRATRGHIRAAASGVPNTHTSWNLR